MLRPNYYAGIMAEIIEAYILFRFFELSSLRLFKVQLQFTSLTFPSETGSDRDVLKTNIFNQLFLVISFIRFYYWLQEQHF